MVSSTSNSNRNSSNNCKAFSRPSVKVAAGLACLSLIGLQLTSDVDTHGSLRRRMEVITDGDDGDDGGMVNVESTANNNKQLAIGAPSLKIPASLGRETQRRLSFNLGGGTVEEQHIGNELCISSVRNGNISTASVIGEDGRYVNLALPTSHSTEMNIECTTTNQKTGEVTTVHSENDGVAGKITSRRLMVNNGCAQKSFQPGKFAYKHLIWICCPLP